MKYPHQYTAEFFDAATIEEYKAIPDPFVNIAFARALVWLAHRVSEGQVVTVEWLLEEAVGTYQMVQQDIEEWRNEQ